MLLPLVFVLVWLVAPVAAQHNGEREVNILVVAIHGEAACRNEWQSTIDYLQTSLPDYHFNLVPLRPIDHREMKRRVARGEIDFVVSQPAIYVDLELEFGITRILTMVKRGGLSEFGSTIITRADSGIRSVRDMKGKVIAGVAKLGFGGWLIGYHELLKQGFDAYRDAGKVEFMGDQTREIEAVLDGRVDVAVIRTGVLEKHAATGNVNPDDFRVLFPKQYPSFPLQVSTPLYPEWAFAKTSNADDELVKQVALAMLSLDKTSKAARDAHFDSWTFPSDYNDVHEILKTLRVGPYENYGDVTVSGFIEQYKTASYLFAALISVILIMTVVIFRSNRSLLKEQREKECALEELRHMATHDGLTGLANRELFIEYLEKYISDAKRRNQRIAVMFIDLDDFKRINDSFGHDVGNDVLKQVGRILQASIRDNDIVARLSGDEFAIVLSDVRNDQNVLALAQRVVRQIPEAQLPRSGLVDFGASVGVLIAEPADYTAYELIQQSDELMYDAKKAGKGRFIVRTSSAPLRS